MEMDMRMIMNIARKRNITKNTNMMLKLECWIADAGEKFQHYYFYR
jgi:hypothetical protein